MTTTTPAPSAAATFHATLDKLDRVRQSLHGEAACACYAAADRYRIGDPYEVLNRWLEAATEAEIRALLDADGWFTADAIATVDGDTLTTVYISPRDAGWPEEGR